jgi:CheY-like chemotaxis protein
MPRGRAPRAAPPAPPPGTRTGRILLVEDVPVNQELATIVLEAGGHRVEVASDGAAAVEAVKAGDFDLVLMDVQMPVMDGVTATRHIRSLDGPKGRIPIVAMTANVLPDQVAEFHEAGMNDHVGKPIDNAVLYATIGNWLGPDDGPAPLGPAPGAMPVDGAGHRAAP